MTRIYFWLESKERQNPTLVMEVINKMYRSTEAWTYPMMSVIAKQLHRWSNLPHDKVEIATPKKRRLAMTCVQSTPDHYKIVNKIYTPQCLAGWSGGLLYDVFFLLSSGLEPTNLQEWLF